MTPASASSRFPARRRQGPSRPCGRRRSPCAAGRQDTGRRSLVRTLPRTDLDEDPDAVLIHALDQFAEAHRLAELAGERLLGAPGIAGIGRSGRIGVDRAAGCDQSLRGEEGLEGLDGAGDDRRMESGRDRQHGDAQPAALQRRFGGGDGRLLAGKHDLLRAVVVGEHHVEAEFGDEFRDRVMAGRHRQHRALGALRGLGHQPATLGSDLECRVEAIGAGGVERHHLAKTVAGEAMGADAERGEKGEHRRFGRGDRRLGEGHPGQPCLLPGAGFPSEGRRREDRVSEEGCAFRPRRGRRPCPRPGGRVRMRSRRRRPCRRIGCPGRGRGRQSPALGADAEVDAARRRDQRDFAFSAIGSTGPGEPARQVASSDGDHRREERGKAGQRRRLAGWSWRGTRQVDPRRSARTSGRPVHMVDISGAAPHSTNLAIVVRGLPCALCPGPLYSDSVMWKFDPPNPNETDRARRVWSRRAPTGGFGVEVERAVSRSSCGFGRSIFAVCGNTL